jgi:hypothetical protein
MYKIQEKEQQKSHLASEDRRKKSLADPESD